MSSSPEAGEYMWGGYNFSCLLQMSLRCVVAILSFMYGQMGKETQEMKQPLRGDLIWRGIGQCIVVL